MAKSTDLKGKNAAPRSSRGTILDLAALRTADPTNAPKKIAEQDDSTSNRGALSEIQPTGSDGGYLLEVPIEKLTANPRNPRDRMDNLDDLATIVDMQLQPATAVTRSAWLRVYPGDTDTIGEAEYVVVNGCRRLAAAKHFGRPKLDIVVRDSVAADNAAVVAAAVIENIARENLDVIEEAKAVEMLVSISPSAAAAARKLGRTGAWVGQRLSLLRLDPRLQEALRAGEIGIRTARELARVPLEDQVDAWMAELDRAQEPAPEPEPEPAPAEESNAESDSEDEESGQVKKIVRALRGAKADPETAAAALEEFFEPHELARVAAMLGAN
ncbi:ParB/RepB/Spo0J family partition protein [Rhodococcus pyridinivorans]|uniref:ParB/RepB/Spo0J family partition protein n=1 Tax=Rhodococcus pyridinivorans TaxID=103816 RepID=UPI002658A317|nr:ParB/RepB/Spo0J family partition protein [Rhodococcus pyridinivorans]